MTLTTGQPVSEKQYFNVERAKGPGKAVFTRSPQASPNAAFSASEHALMLAKIVVIDGWLSSSTTASDDASLTLSERFATLILHDVMTVGLAS